MEIRPNRVKQKLATGEIAYVVSGFTHPDDIDAFGPVGFDGIWLEGEHGPVDAAELGNLTRACDIWGMTSVVRVNRNDQGLVYRTLDRGAQGIVVPHVNTAEEAKAVVDASKFAPIGSRGMNVGRQGYGVPDYAARTNDETLIVICIEDIVAVENLRDILSVDHVDVFFVAPGDLAQSMGYLDQHEFNTGDCFIELQFTARCPAPRALQIEREEVERLARDRDDELVLLTRGEVVDRGRDLALGDAAVRGLDEPERVDPRERGERADQTDVRAFRRLDRAHPSVVSRMDVANLEPGPFPGQTTRPQRGNPTLVGDFRERIILVHELGELAGAEELLHGRRHRLRVDHLLGHEALGFRQSESLFDGPFDPYEADAKRVLCHLANAAHTPITEMVNVINLTVTVSDVYQGAQDIEDVLLAQDRIAFGLLPTHPAVEFHAPDRR
mgnify:CR=1 FL=1